MTRMLGGRGPRPRKSTQGRARDPARHAPALPQLRETLGARASAPSTETHLDDPVWSRGLHELDAESMSTNAKTTRSADPGRGSRGASRSGRRIEPTSSQLIARRSTLPWIRWPAPATNRSSAACRRSVPTMRVAESGNRSRSARPRRARAYRGEPTMKPNTRADRDRDDPDTRGDRELVVVRTLRDRQEVFAANPSPPRMSDAPTTLLIVDSPNLRTSCEAGRRRARAAPSRRASTAQDACARCRAGGGATHERLEDRTVEDVVPTAVFGSKPKIGRAWASSATRRPCRSCRRACRRRGRITNCQVMRRFRGSVMTRTACRSSGSRA